MSTDTRAQIVERLDAIFFSLGFESVRESRDTLVVPVSRFLTNFARLVEGLANSPDPDQGFSKLLGNSTEEELKKHLHLLVTIEVVAVPVVKKILDFAKSTATARGPGRPRFARSLEVKKAICAYVAERIYPGGDPEKKAIKEAAKHFTKLASVDPDWVGPKTVGPKTIKRIWDRRKEIEQEVDIGAMFGSLIETLASLTFVDWEPKPALLSGEIKDARPTETIK